MQDHRNRCESRKMLTEEEKEAARLDAIVEEASKLPLELQQYVLATIKGMLLAKEQTLKQEHAASKQSSNE